MVGITDVNLSPWLGHSGLSGKVPQQDAEAQQWWEVPPKLKLKLI